MRSCIYLGTVLVIVGFAQPAYPHKLGETVSQIQSARAAATSSAPVVAGQLDPGAVSQLARAAVFQLDPGAVSQLALVVVSQSAQEAASLSRGIAQGDWTPIPCDHTRAVEGGGAVVSRLTMTTMIEPHASEGTLLVGMQTISFQNTSKGGGCWLRRFSVVWVEGELHCRLAVVLATLSVVLTGGCQTAAQNWVRVDGKPATRAELEQAKAICDADRPDFDWGKALLGAAAGLSSVNNPEQAETYRRQMPPDRRPLKACMAANGYIAQ